MKPERSVDFVQPSFFEVSMCLRATIAAVAIAAARLPHRLVVPVGVDVGDGADDVDVGVDKIREQLVPIMTSRLALS
jgi:hypothetical protein